MIYWTIKEKMVFIYYNLVNQNKLLYLWTTMLCADSRVNLIAIQVISNLHIAGEKMAFLLFTMEGWIKLYRAIFKWEWFDDEKMVKFFISLIIMANHETGRWHGITIERGQFITSLDKLAALLNFSKQQVRTMLKKLQSSGEITHKSTHKYSVITICEYDNYQCDDNTNQHTDQHTNNTQITHKQHTSNTVITLNKNDKNDKNDNNEKNDKNSVVRFTPPTTEEVKAYCEERKNGIDAQRFIDFYSSKGWMIGKSKMKDWKAAVRTWEKTERPAPAQKYQETLNVNKFWNVKN